MADPQPQTTDQGFLPGLLGNVGGWFGSYDPQAAYGGLLSDPATKRAFQVRELGAAAQAMAQASMPVPYKGGMPWGSFLGSAGGAAATAGDSLIQARLQQAQSEQAVQNAAALHAKQLATSEILKNYQDPNSIYNRGGGTGTGTGTGTDGKPLTGPAKIIASQGGGAGGISPTDHYSFLLDNGASKNEATMLTSAANSESSFRPDLTHDHGIGYGLYGHNTDRLAAMRDYAGVGPNDPVPWQQQALFALAELRGEVKGLPGGGEPKAGAMVNAATNAQQLTDAQLAFERPNLNIAGGNRSQRLASTTEYWNKPPYAQSPTQTASAGDQPAAAPGSQVGPYAPVPGQPPPQGVYVPPGASPNAPPVRIEGGPPPAAPPGGLLKLPDPTSAAPPQLLTPPAAGTPGPAAAAGSPTLGLLAAQQGGGDVGSPLGAATPQIAGIPSRGLLAQVAGPGAADPSASPAAVTQQSQLPHTGAAGAAELAGLLAQQPAPATATPYTNAPPITGQGAPAPGPAPGPAPPAPAPALGGAAPPMPQPVTPSAIPGAPSAQDVRDANRAVILHGIAGIPLPPNISEIAKFPMVGPTAQATAAGTAAGQQPYQLQQAANKAMWDIYVAQQKPRDPQRQGTFAFNPQTGQYTLNRELIEADGSTHQHISILDQNLKPLSDYDAGPIKASPGAVATSTGLAGENVKDFATVQQEARAAAGALTQATFMRQEAPNFQTGPGSHEINFMNKALVSLGLGGDQAAKSAASYESFIKDGGALARAQAQAISQRVGVQELQAVAGTMPGAENTQRGLDRTLAQIQGLSDYRLMKQQAMTNYMGPAHPENAGSNAGFEASFNKNISPYTYMYMRMSDQDRGDIRNQLSSTKAGQADLQRLQGQIKYITDNNLMPVQ